ncbi:zinc finger, CCHC-type containing protein [Tanacetum coccineum]
MTPAREIWNSLEGKYTIEKEGADKFITFKFFEFSMEDNVSILDQVYESLILKHLRIKEETRNHEKNLNGASSSKINYVDSGKNNKGNDKKRKGTWNSSKYNKKEKKPLSEVVCYKLEQVDTIVSEMNIGMIQELHMASVTTTTNDWWYDCGATTHVWNNKDLLKTYKETKDGHEVMMGDNHTLKVIRSRNLEIQFTSGKKLTLMNVLHVPNIRKNLVYGFKLCKSGVKAMIESYKVILSKANVFVRKAYACDGMFKLSINKITNSAYFPDCNFISNFNIECSIFNSWHNRLGHINYKTMKDMLKQGIISYNGEHKDKCEICVQAKMKRKPFPKVDRQFEILELVHCDICELNGQLTRGGNRTTPYTPQQNGVAERKNSVLQDMINAILDLNSSNKRNMAESSSAPRRSKRARKKRNLDPDFIDSQAIIFLVEGDNENNVINKIPFLLNVEDAPKSYKEIIDKFQHLSIEEANTPYESFCKLVDNDGRAIAQIEYASVICCLMYATHCTRPDIAYVVCKLSRYTSDPGQEHWKVIGRVFGYLKRTRQLALYYDHFPTILKGYSAAWVTGSSDSKTITGLIITLSGGAVCWGSKKQTCITYSTMEAELLALAAVSKEAEWLRNMLLDIELWPQPMPAVFLHCDS